MEAAPSIMPSLHWVHHQTKVPTAKAGSSADAVRPANRIENFCAWSVSFKTINTFWPLVVWNATFGKLDNEVDSMRTELGLTNFEAWPMI